MTDSRPQLSHLLEALSIAQRWQTEDPPNASMQAVLQLRMKALLADLKALADESQRDSVEQSPAAD